jgi:uncharacterized protein
VEFPNENKSDEPVFLPGISADRPEAPPTAGEAPFVEGSGDAGDGAAIPTAKLSRRFCKGCGAIWQVEWSECPTCARGREKFSASALLPIDRGTGRIKSAIALYLSLLTIIAISMVAQEFGARAINCIVISEIWMSAVVLAWGIIQWKQLDLLVLHIPSPLWMGIAALSSIFTLAIAFSIIAMFSHFSHEKDPGIGSVFLKAGYGWGTVFLAIAVQPAIFEELAFRGVILGALQGPLRPVEAVVVSAMMFMVLHLSVARFPHTLALGLAAGFLRIRTRSLYPGMLLHFIHNSACVGIEWMGK